MNRVVLIIILCVLELTLGSFTGEQQVTKPLSDKKEIFPFPAIPTNLTAPTERASFLLTHYWDSVDFYKHEVSEHDALMEQGFVDFLSVFPHTTDSIRQQAIQNLLMRALVRPSKIQPLVDLVEIYLYDLHSPMVNEPYYKLFVQEMLAMKGWPLDVREKLRFQLAAMNKNSVGTKVSDFFWIDNEQHKQRLYDVDSEITLLFFYDAECAECKHVLAEMEKSDFFSSQSEKELKVITVCVEGNNEQREQTASKFPPSWAKGTIEDFSSLMNDYVFRIMPTIYLLDRDKRVILKDVSWQRLKAFVAG